MKCSRCRSLFDPAHDGSLDRGSPLRAEFDEHLASCPECSQGWSQWQQAMSALQGLAAGRASQQETDAVLQAVDRAAQLAESGLEPIPQLRWAPGPDRRVAALLLAAACGALAASLVFLLCWPRARAPAAGTSQASSLPVAAAPTSALTPTLLPTLLPTPLPLPLPLPMPTPAPTPHTARELPTIVIDTAPLADVLRALGAGLQQRLLARNEAPTRPASPGPASPAASPLGQAAPDVASFVPLAGEVLVSRTDGRLSLTLVAASPDDVPDFRALVPPLLQLLSTPDEELVRLAEARLESVRSQVERLTGPGPALANEPATDDSPRDSSGWRRLLGLPPAQTPEAPAEMRWRNWWEAVEPLLPDVSGAT